MITPKLRARELVTKMWDDTPGVILNKEFIEENYLGIDDCISSAIVVTEEILDVLEEIPDLDVAGNILLDKIKYYSLVLSELRSL